MFLLTALSTYRGYAQETTATFYSTVTDSSGAVILGATVRLKNDATGAIATKTTDASGECVFDFLHIGVYTLQIEAQGFKRYESKGNEFQAAQSVRHVYVLEVGAMTESVSVQASAAQVNTVTTEQNSSFSTAEVLGLPVAQRSFSKLLPIGTGISTETNGNVEMNGVGRSGLKVTVDGTNATSNPEGPGTSMYQSPGYVDVMSIEAIQEVQVVKGVIPAEYGEQLSGTVNLITKSGTNQWHGSLFENSQSYVLNGRNQFSLTRPSSAFNQFGGAGGGPIRRNRIFIFGVYEGYRQNSPVVVTSEVPTPLLQAEAEAAVPAYTWFFKQYPLPNQPYGPTAVTGNYIGNGTTTGHDNMATVKGDILLTSSSSLALTYSRGRPFSTQPRVSPTDPITWDGMLERGTANFITGGADWTSETRFGYDYSHLSRNDGYWAGSLDPAAPETVFGGARFPSIEFPGFSAFNPTYGAGSKFVNYGGPAWSLEEKYARHAGQHSIKFGGIYAFNGAGRANISAPDATYASVSDLLANIPSSVAFSFGSNQFTSHNWTVGFFLQDDWRLSSKLVINLGLRYDYFSDIVVQPVNTSAPAGMWNWNGLLNPYTFTFGPLRSNPAEPINSDGCGSLCNLGPRVGFSYNPDGHGLTVIRGGLSVMFAPQPLDDYNSGVSGSAVLPLNATYTKLQLAALGWVYPIFNQVAIPVVEALNQVTVTRAFDPNIQNPYTLNLYFGLQRQLTPSIMIESAYVGNAGRKIRLVRGYNYANPATGIRPNPSLGQGNYFISSQNSEFYSWQTTLRKRYSKNLAGAVNYTWGKALSTSGGDEGSNFNGDTIYTVQDFNNVGENRGPSPFDAAQRFNTEFVYDLPSLASVNSAALRRIAGGWTVSGVFNASTGLPTELSESSSAFASRPNYIGGNPYASNASRTLQYLNRTVFAVNPVGSLSNEPLLPGNVGNDAIRLPGLWNLDFSLAKIVSLTERLKLQIRGDFLNGLNHTNFNAISTSVNSANFGQFTATAGARIIQLNARLTF